MVIGIVYVLAVTLFTIAFFLTRLPQSCSEAFSIARQSMMVMIDKKLDDDAKETVIQQAALKMLQHVGLIAVKSIVAFTATIIPIWLADVMALSSWQSSTEFALRWDVLLITLIVMTVAWVVLRHWNNPSPS